VARHLLADKDLAAKTAVCSVCGPVEIRSAGKSWICLNKKRESAAAWQAANPEKAAANRAAVSEHHLVASDPEVRRGICPIDGDVDIVPFGRGWACAVRAAELRTVVQDETPRCRVCYYPGSNFNPVVDGYCEYDRPGNIRPAVVPLSPLFDPGASHPVELPKYEAAASVVPARESAVPGWKMIGQDVPADEWAKWETQLAAEGL
jgi:hypothetical protein